MAYERLPQITTNFLNPFVQRGISIPKKASDYLPKR